MFSPPWSVSNHNFYIMGMQNVQKLEDWSDGLLSFTFSSALWPNLFPTHYCTEAIQSQCLRRTRYVWWRAMSTTFTTQVHIMGLYKFLFCAQCWRPLPHKRVTGGGCKEPDCLVCGSLLKKKRMLCHFTFCPPPSLMSSYSLPRSASVYKCVWVVD